MIWIVNAINGKAASNHTHSNYAASSHNHTGYAKASLSGTTLTITIV